MIEQGLYQYLTTQLAGQIDNRVYPGPLPSHPTLPAVTVSRESTDDTITHDEGQTDFVGASVQVDAWGADYQSATSLYEAVHAALRNFKGYMGAVKVHAVFRQTVGDFYEQDVPGYRRSAIYIIWFRQ